MAYSTSGIASGSVGAAAAWIEQLLFGSVGVAIAVLAVGLLGFRMLLGYSSPKEAGRILLGCFILFGAPAIARALAGAAPIDTRSVPGNLVTPAAALPRSDMTRMPSTSTNPFDPNPTNPFTP